MVVARSDLPTYGDLMLPVLRSMVVLGGSGSSKEVTDEVVAAIGASDAMVALSYDNRDKSVLLDRVAWARSYCKLGGALESPRRGLFLLTDLGEQIVALEEDAANEQLRELDREVRRRRHQSSPNGGDDEADLDSDENDSWKTELLEGLHQLSPDAFERFTLYLLRSYGMKLTRIGGPGDEGVDGIGTAPLTEVLTTTVAVQAKRYEPTKTIGREVVALFQSDASARGAEHGILVTTARFSKPAELSALGRPPTIDLIDGDRLAELCLEQGIGVETRPVVNSQALDRFENDRSGDAHD